MTDFGNIVNVGGYNVGTYQDSDSKVYLSNLPTGTVGISRNVVSFRAVYISDNAGEREFTELSGIPSGTMRTYEVLLGNGTGSTTTIIAAETGFCLAEASEHDPTFFGLIKTGDETYKGYYYVHYYDPGDTHYHCKIREIEITHGGSYTDTLLQEIDMSGDDWWHLNRKITIDKMGYLGLARADLIGGDGVGYSVFVYGINMENGTVSEVVNFGVGGDEDNVNFPQMDAEGFPLEIANSNGTLAWATLYTNFDYINCKSTTHAVINGADSAVKELIDTSFPICSPPGQSAYSIHSVQYNSRDYLFELKFECDTQRTVIYTPTGGYQLYIAPGDTPPTIEYASKIFRSRKAYPGIVHPFGGTYCWVNVATGETGEPFMISNSTGTVATGTSSNMNIYPTLDTITGYIYISYNNQILGVDPASGEIKKTIPISVSIGTSGIMNHGNFFARVVSFVFPRFTYIDNGYAVIAVNECIIIEQN